MFRRGGRNPVFIVLLLARVLTDGTVPPITLTSILGMTGIHFFGNWRLSSVCIGASNILVQRQYSRLLLSGLFHVDDMHLYFNMSSLLWKGKNLEPQIGPNAFAKLLIGLLLLGNIVSVAIAKILSSFFTSNEPFYECAVGFSGVLFGLKVILNSMPERQGNNSSVFGMEFPTKYAAWVELLLIQLLVPHVSFIGHLSGIIAGLLIVYFDRNYNNGSILRIRPERRGRDNQTSIFDSLREIFYPPRAPRRDDRRYRPEERPGPSSNTVSQNGLLILLFAVLGLWFVGESVRHGWIGLGGLGL